MGDASRKRIFRGESGGIETSNGGEIEDLKTRSGEGSQCDDPKGNDNRAVSDGVTTYSGCVNHSLYHQRMAICQLK